MFCVHSARTNISCLWSPKCACTEVRQLFYWLHPEDMLREKPTREWHSIQNDFATKANPEHAFYIARHPYLRCISMYCHFFRTICKLEKKYEVPIFASFHKHMGKNAKHTFRNFVLYVRKALLTQDKSLNLHFQRQTQSSVPVDWAKVRIIKLENNRVPDELIQFYAETLKHDGFTEKIKSFYNKDHPKNITPKRCFEATNQEIINSEPIDVYPLPEQFFDEELAKLIEQAYAKDYQILGYRKGLRALQHLLKK